MNVLINYRDLNQYNYNLFYDDDWSEIMKDGMDSPEMEKITLACKFVREKMQKEANNLRVNFLSYIKSNKDLVKNILRFSINHYIDEFNDNANDSYICIDEISAVELYNGIIYKLDNESEYGSYIESENVVKNASKIILKMCEPGTKLEDIEAVFFLVYIDFIPRGNPITIIKKQK